MSKNAVQTNALGRKVRVTMGMNEGQIAQGRSPDSHWICWRRLGDTATVTSVYMNEGVLCYMLGFGDQCAEVGAAHCVFVNDKPA